jgi:predicted RNase H-like HicB family nuclease
LTPPSGQTISIAAPRRAEAKTQEDELRNDNYIALFRALPKDKWRVVFPDLPGCEAKGENFKEAFQAARRALARHLHELEDYAPRPRSTAELLIDAQRDWVLCRQFVDAVMHPVPPADVDELAPLELVAIRSASSTPLASL